MNESNKFFLPVNIEPIYENIRDRIYEARKKIYKYIDNTAVEVYWYIGKTINEVLNGNARAKYGKAVIDTLSKKLTVDFGGGFDPTNLRKMRRFYDYFPNWDTVCPELSWSHFRELIKIERDSERNFYIQESINSNWGVRELQRQINTKLYDRILISKDKNYIEKMSKKGLIVNKPEDILKNPYIFEFAGLKEKIEQIINDNADNID